MDRLEEVGGTPATTARRAVLVEVEQVGPGPDVSAVLSDVDRQVAEQADVAMPAAVAHRPPLAGEEVLDESMELDLKRASRSVAA